MTWFNSSTKSYIVHTLETWDLSHWFRLFIIYRIIRFRHRSGDIVKYFVIFSLFFCASHNVNISEVLLRSQNVFFFFDADLCAFYHVFLHFVFSLFLTLSLCSITGFVVILFSFTFFRWPACATLVLTRKSIDPLYKNRLPFRDLIII